MVAPLKHPSWPRRSKRARFPLSSAFTAEGEGLTPNAPSRFHCFLPVLRFILATNPSYVLFSYDEHTLAWRRVEAVDINFTPVDLLLYTPHSLLIPLTYNWDIPCSSLTPHCPPSLIGQNLLTRTCISNFAMTCWVDGQMTMVSCKTIFRPSGTVLCLAMLIRVRKRVHVIVCPAIRPIT